MVKHWHKCDCELAHCLMQSRDERHCRRQYCVVQRKDQKQHLHHDDDFDSDDRYTYNDINNYKAVFDNELN